MTTTAAPAPSTAVGPDHPVREGLGLGLGLTALMLVVIMALAGEVIPPALLLAVVMVATAVGAARSDARWLRWLGAAVPTLLLIAFAPFLVADLGHPESPASFGPTFVLAVCALGSIVAGVSAALRRPVGLRRVWGTAGVVVLAGVALTVVQGTGVQADAAQPGDVVVEAAYPSFPAQVSVAVGDGLLLHNADPIRHTFVVEGEGIAQELPGSTDRRLAVDLPAGEYRFFCDVPGHESMEGTLVVTAPA